MRTSLANFDIMNIPVPISGVCCQFEIINIRGYECVSCTAPLWNSKGLASLHTDSSRNVCQFNGNRGDVVGNEDNFGNYGNFNPTFVVPPVQILQLSSGSGDNEDEFPGDSWTTRHPMDAQKAPLCTSLG